jgi:thiamine-phosphate pyrophosphorylase
MIIAVTDRKNSLRPFLEQLEVVADAGPDMIILREKDLTQSEYLELAKKCNRICEDHDITFCINRFTDIASELGAGVVQIPYNTFAERGGYVGRESVLVSVHSALEAREAEKMGANAVIYGNVFETSCKPGLPAKGLDLLKEVSDSVLVPVFGIGGINEKNIIDIAKTGADGVCIMSGFMRASDPEILIKAYKSAFS